MALKRSVDEGRAMSSPAPRMLVEVPRIEPGSVQASCVLLRVRPRYRCSAPAQFQEQGKDAVSVIPTFAGFSDHSPPNASTHAEITVDPIPGTAAVVAGRPTPLS